MKKFICIALFLFVQTIYAENISTPQNQLTGYINSHSQNQILLLKKLVNIKSGTTNPVGVYQVGEVLRPEFEKLGFKTYWVKNPAYMNRAGSLIAERTGSRGQKLLLIGHLDTVFLNNSESNSFSEKNNTATGPGVLDDKGGSVVLLYALKALENQGYLNNTTIRVVLTGDEEAAGRPRSISRKALIDSAKQSDIALDFESAVTLDTASIARRGISNWKIQTTGNEGHSFEIFQKPAGYGAIYELSRILNAVQTELSHEKYLSINTGIISGGTTATYDNNNFTATAFGKENVIPKIAYASGDMRFLTRDQKINAQNKMNKIIQQNLPGTTANITFQEGIPSMPPTDNNLKLLEQYSEISRNLGYGEVKALDPGMRGAGDISYIASMVQACLVGLGPIGNHEHSAQETIDLKSLPIQTSRTAMLIYQLTHL